MMTALEAIEQILAQTGAPMTVAGITEAIISQGLWRSSAKVPTQSIHAVLAGDIARKGPRSRFSRTAPGTYGLSRWDADGEIDSTPPTELTHAVPQAPEMNLGLAPETFSDKRETELPQLKAQLWRALDILRGELEAPESLLHVLGLVLYKRISDTWQEEVAERHATATYEFDPHDPHIHRFIVPPGDLWQHLRAWSRGVGERLNRTLSELGRENPALRDVFTDLDFNRPPFSGGVLEQLLHCLDGISLRPVDVSSEMLGMATDNLITRFAYFEGRRGGELTTPRMVAHLMVECLRPQDGMTLYDPTCGTGRMLIEAGRYVDRHGRHHQALGLFGQDRRALLLALCKMNLLLHDIDHADIRYGDTLRSPLHVAGEEGAALMTFDRILANPPMSLQDWGHDDWKKGDRYGRDRFGCPPKSGGDLAFLLHVIASLKEDGIGAVVLPQALLSRRGPEASIRDRLLQEDLIEAVIGLAPKLFFGTSVAKCLLILNRRKAPERRGKVLFIQGASEALAGSNKNILLPAHAERLANAYHAFKDVPHFCSLVDVDRIRANGHDLSIEHYLERPQDSRRIVKSIVDYLKVIDLITHEQKPGTTLFYRGHGNTTYELVPSLYREDTYVAAEDRMYKELIMSDPHDFGDDHSALEKLVRMQHFNLPTRLLDLTLNPLVALFFACNQEKGEPDGEIIVLAIPDEEIKFYDSDAVSIVANLSKRPIEDKQKLQYLTQTPEFSQATYKRGTLNKFNHYEIAQRLLHEIREEKPYFLGKINPNDLLRVMCVKAKRNNKRIVAQDGAFLLFGLGRQIDEPAQVPEAWSTKKKVGTIIVDQKSKNKIRKELERLNIRDSTMFPDIEKTAMHVKDKYGPQSRTGRR